MSLFDKLIQKRLAPVVDRMTEETERRFVAIQESHAAEVTAVRQSAERRVLDARVIKFNDLTNGRSFDGADMGNLFADWRPDYGFSFAAVRWNYAIMRSRGRDFAKNSPHGRAFVNIVAQNVVHRGFLLHVQAADIGRDGKPVIDVAASHELESAFVNWATTPEYCDAAGKSTFAMMCQEAARLWPRDGEYLFRILDGGATPDNPYKFSLKAIRPDYLDHLYCEDLPNGNKILMGIEVNQWGRPVRYWFRQKVGLDWADTDYPTGERFSVPAEDIIHGFIEEDPDQPRGITWFHAIMKLMRMTDQYAFAEVTSARQQASTGMAFEPINEAAANLDAGQVDANGKQIQAYTPGDTIVTPIGYTAKMLQATHPNANYAAGKKAFNREVSSGLLVAYHKLCGDLEGVSYSSIRSGELSERDIWQTLQDHMISTLCRRVYLRWLRMYLLSGKTKLPSAKYDKWASHSWSGRTWPWVDPMSDAQSNAIAEDRGWKTKRQNAAAMGNDFDDVLDDRERDRKAVEGKKDKLAGFGFGGDVAQTEKV